MARFGETKMLRLQFHNLNGQDEMKLRKFLNDSLLRGVLVLKESVDSRVNDRSDFRVSMNLTALMTTQSLNRLPPLTFNVQVTDLSAWGACVLVDDSLQVLKNGQVQLTMNFVEKYFTVEAKILGLKMRR